MGTVDLCGYHQNLDDKTKYRPLTNKLLANRILNQHNERMKHSRMQMLKAMLRALVDLQGIDAVVSLYVDWGPNGEHLKGEGRLWGKLSLTETGVEILRFSHDTRYDNHPFQTLYQWLEDEWPADMSWEHPDYSRECEKWYNTDKWKSFFRQRLERKVSRMLSEAEHLRELSNELCSQVAHVQALL